MLPAEWQMRVALWPAFALLAAERVEERLLAPPSALFGLDLQLGHAEIGKTSQPLVRGEDTSARSRTAVARWRASGSPETVLCADLSRPLDDAWGHVDNQEIPGSEDGIEARQGIEIPCAHWLHTTLQP
jgi:hypothetical protein